MDIKILAGALALLLGFLCYGYGYHRGEQFGANEASAMYSKKLLDISQRYSKSIEDARALELIWKTKADAIEKSYKKKLADNIHSNDVIINKLQFKLDEASKRLSSNSNTSSKFDDSSRRAELSKGIEQITRFADRCARRHDELVIQVDSLQQWINKETK